MEVGSRAPNVWKCALCGGNRFHVSIRGPDYEYSCRPGLFTLVRCEACGHVSLEPLPEAEAVSELYPPTYYTVNPASPLYLQGIVYDSKIRRDVRRIHSYVNVEGLRSIVDIGCGDVRRLLELRRIATAPACIGFDLRFQPEVIKRARDADIQLVEGNIELDSGKLSNQAHDLIIMSQILEHLRDPVGTLVMLRKKLSPGGFLLIETPNLGGLDYALFRKMYWGGYHLPRHFHLFTKDSLADTAKRIGYRIARQGSLPSPGFWIISFRNALGLNSRRRGSSLFEFLNFSNLPVVGLFTAVDLVCIALGRSTSNQVLLLSRE